MNAIEKLTVEHVAAIRELSRSMDRRNSALNEWATGGKSDKLLRIFQVADVEYNQAYRRCIELRGKLQIAVNQFHLNAHTQLYREYLYRRRA